MTSISAKVLALAACLSTLPLVVGLTGCASDPPIQVTDQRIDDRRTAERVRESLAAASEYRFEGVRVAAVEGVIELNGSVTTSAQRRAAGDLASKVVGVKIVKNNLAIKE